MNNSVIKTERLILRPLTVGDAEAVFKWVSDERVTKYMVYNTYSSVDQVKEWLKSVEASTVEHHFGFERISDGDLVGSGSIGPDNKEGFWGFGYNFRYDCWGNGYATEAAKAMIKYAYDNFGIRKFASSHVEQNKASGRVIEKCGLHFVGYGEFQKNDGTHKMRSMEYEGEF